jgi:beta-N-acetylhexosaminidase
MRDLGRDVARMFCIGFDGTSIPRHVEALLKRGVGAAALFRRNVESPQQFATLCAQLKNLSGKPFIIGIDQEGGRVMRLRGQFTDVPSMRDVGKTNDESLAEQVGQVLARESRAMNVDVVFAPVLDVDTNPNNPVIADRSLGGDPASVARLGVALIRGIQGAGVAACGKHFPGHGDTWQDSHFTLPMLEHDMSRIERIELPPFEAAVRAGVATIMTAHVVFKPIDPRYPATLSRTILDGILRRRLGYDNVLISDDMEMKAIAANFGIEDAIVQAVNAGIDLFAICHSHELQNRAIDSLIRGVANGQVSRDRIDEANQRIDRLCQQYIKPPVDNPDLSLIGCAAHQQVAARVREAAKTTAAAPADPTEQWRRPASSPIPPKS